MQVNIHELLTKREPIRVQASLDVAPLFADMRDAAPLGPMSADVTVRAAGGVIEASGRLTGRLRLLCSRCLKPLEEAYCIPYEETFKPVPKGQTEEESVEDDCVLVSGDRLELRPHLENELLLHLPLAPLCDEGCRGLCPVCGQNLNERECGCERETIDPRLAALKEWLEGGREDS